MRSKDSHGSLVSVCARRLRDIRHTLPQDARGPFFNDEFGTTFGNIYALTGEGFDYAIMKDYADRLQLALQRGGRTWARWSWSACRTKKIWVEHCQHQAGVPGHSAGDGAAGPAVAECGGRRGFFLKHPAAACACGYPVNSPAWKIFATSPFRWKTRTLRLGDNRQRLSGL